MARAVDGGGDHVGELAARVRAFRINALNTPRSRLRHDDTLRHLPPEPTGMSDVFASTCPADGGGAGLVSGPAHAAKGATAAPMSSDRRVGILTG